MESKTSNVSVIIPFYANAKWLDEALHSAINQTYQPYEIIVVNDGSKENIEPLIDKYKSKVSFHYQENCGAAKARNKGIDESKGDIIAFLDSDDIWKEDKLEKQVKYMDEQNLMWCTTAYETFGSDRCQIVTPYYYDGLSWEHMYNACKIGTPTVAVRREALLNNRFAEDMRNGQDTFLWFKLSAQYKMGVITEPLVKVRMRQGSTVTRFDAHIRNRSLLWEKMICTHELKEPQRVLTRVGYKICSWIRKNDPQIHNSKKNKLLFGCAWLLWRTDNILLECKYKKGIGK